MSLRTQIAAAAAALPSSLQASMTLTPELRQRAQNACQGTINFWCNGMQPTPVGRRDIAWHGPHHQHQEWPAQLNRFFFLGSLAAAWQETRELEYGEAAADYLEDWLRAHPPVAQMSALPRYDNTLNVSIRLGQSQNAGWLGSLPPLLDHPRFTEELLARLLASVACQLDYLMRHLTPEMNWRISQADCLLVCGLRLAFLPEAAAWRQMGVNVLNDARHRQIRAGGVHAECNPGYHHWMTRVMCRYWQVAEEAPQLGLCMTRELVAEMYDYALACTRPFGGYNAMHDCTGPITGASGSNWAGEVMVAQERAAFRRRAGLPATLPPPQQWYPSAGQALLRDSWSTDATYLTFDATVWGGAHCHLSRNAIQVHAHGRALLVDPGTLTYEGSDPASAHGRSTRAHNTLTLNGLNQSPTDPARSACRLAPGYAVVSSDYEGGYWAGTYLWGWDRLGEGHWASHNRLLCWCHGRFIAVFDSLARVPRQQPEPPEAQPSLEQYWQFGEDPVTFNPSTGQVLTGHPDANVLMLFPHLPEGVEYSLHRGEREPVAGWLPSQQGLCPAPQLRLRLPRMAKRHELLVTVILPFAGGPAEAPQVSAQFTPATAGQPGCLRLTWANGERDEVWLHHRAITMLGQGDGWATDGSLLHLHRDATGQIRHGAALDATWVRPWMETPNTSPTLLTFHA